MSDVRLSHKKMINIDLSKKVRVVYPQNHSDLFGLGFDESGHIGFQREITNENKLDSDLVDDTNSSNKFTNSQEKTKLAGIESGAQVNVIEQISVNGVPAQVDANKNVNLVILLEAGVKLTYVGATGVLSLLDEDNNVLSSVDLPLELLIQSGYYDSQNKNIVLVLANQDTIVIPVADILNGVATQEWVNLQLQNYVQKQSGKGLSTNDFTNEYKEKVDNMPTKTSDLINDSGFIDSTYHDNTKQDLLSGSSSVDITSNVVSVKQDYIDSQFLSNSERQEIIDEISEVFA